MDSGFLVIGAGAFGTALSLVTAKNGYRTHLYGRDPAFMATLDKDRENKRYLPGHHFPETLIIEKDLAKACHTCQDILIVVPSHAFPDTVRALKPHLHQHTRITWATKGLDPDHHYFLHETVRHIIAHDRPMAAIAGPSFATEVAEQKATAINIASTDNQLAQDMQQRFNCHYFRLSIMPDLIGLQLGGVVKNILAVAAGISDGLSLGANARSALITYGINELSVLNEALGGQKNSLMALSGLGDLVLTCTGNLSRNRRFGLALGQGMDAQAAADHVGALVEGWSNAKQLHDLATQMQVKGPIIESMYQVIHNNQPAQACMRELMANLI